MAEGEEEEGGEEEEEEEESHSKVGTLRVRQLDHYMCLDVLCTMLFKDRNHIY